MDPDVIPLYKAVNECKIDADSPLEDKKAPMLNGKDEPFIGSYDFGPKFIQMRLTDGVRELQTVIRDKATPRNDFIFYADRLIRLLVEEGLNKLPYRKCDVVTPTGQVYEGLRYEKGNCGVSIVRSGEAMEQGLRDCCRSIRIGKILVQSDDDTHDARVVYANLPKDINQRKVLLMYPIMCTGNTVAKAIEILQMNNVKEENIILLNLFCTPQSADQLVSKFPGMTILTTEVHPVAPSHFGQKYFGTD
ncbi:uracil phosphoribosyltransferase-like protein [Plakobranchus ocellatus]|uniref:Uracil phosphoribosyltransferase homolog n=1 Tax=Plakobranchus ocellatus TaxID=259542 RepID=A0AAV4AP27_9GAST|nr:uracil phosphoribosyltransferase-like protein [Plakobranchus ocellatus]